MLALSTSFASTVIDDGRQLLKVPAQYDIAHFKLEVISKGVSLVVALAHELMAGTWSS